MEVTRCLSSLLNSGRVELHRRSVPMLPIHTAAPVAGQLRQLLGHGAGG